MTYLTKLRRLAETAPKLAIAAAQDSATPSGICQLCDTSTVPTVSAIIPAYNEAGNIEACVRSVLQSMPRNTSLSTELLEVWVVDDQSSDATLTIAQTLQQTLNDPRLQVLAGEPRPEQQTWMGKNWACTQAAKHAAGDFLLFLDADVRLHPGAIAAAMATVQREQVDLLTVCPAIVCGCFAEWLIQPWLMSLLIAGFDANEVNDPQSDAAFATGMFMLFRRTAYEKLGGHQAVADQAVEDVELARRVKQQGLTLKYMFGTEVGSVRMYRSLPAIWEGWTKNWHLGSRRNLSTSLFSAVIMLLVCVVPWLGLAAILYKSTVGLDVIDGLTLATVLITIGLHYRIRCAVERVAAIPSRYWWLSGIGGALVAAIAIASIIKTETGWGWTWRGRSLKLPDTVRGDG